MKSIRELDGIHLGEDVYIICSGSSLDYINPAFFEGKITIGVNLAFRHFPVKYVVAHHDHFGQEVINKGFTLVISDRKCCLANGPLNRYEGEYYVYKHRPQGYLKIDTSVLDHPDYLVVGGTTVINALSFAYRLGAKSIILVGNDGVMIDGKHNFAGYYQNSSIPQQVWHAQNVRGIVEGFVNLLRSKGVGVYSLNPFVNMRFEGHNIK